MEFRKFLSILAVLFLHSRTSTACDEVALLDNGTFQLTGIKAGDKVTYKCNEGFVLYGDEVSTCGWNSEWSGKPPSCLRYLGCDKVERSGTKYPAGYYPWLARMQTAKSATQGVIVNDKWILTVAQFVSHVANEEEILVFLGLTGTTTKSVPLSDLFPGGDPTVSMDVTENSDSTQAYAVQKTVTHPKFKPLTFQHDLALIRVGRRVRKANVWDGKYTVDPSSEERISFTEYIRPACLTCLSEAGMYLPHECAQIETILSTVRRLSGVEGGFQFALDILLSQNSVEIVPLTNCGEYAHVDLSSKKNREALICSDATDKDIKCLISGNPLMLMNHYVVGLGSYGPTSCEMTIYTSVSATAPWISGVIGNE